MVTHHSNDPKPFTIKRSNQCLMLQGSFQIHVSMTHAPAPSTHCNSSPSIARMRQAQRNTLNDRHLLGKRHIAMVVSLIAAYLLACRRILFSGSKRHADTQCSALPGRGRGNAEHNRGFGRCHHFLSHDMQDYMQARKQRRIPRHLGPRCGKQLSHQMGLRHAFRGMSFLRVVLNRAHQRGPPTGLNVYTPRCALAAWTCIFCTNLH